MSRFFRRSAQLPEEVQSALFKLGRLPEQQPDLAELAATNAALLETMYKHELPPAQNEITPRHARLKQEAGLPLLRGEPIAFDAAGLREQFLRLCDVMEKRGNEFAAALGRAAKRGDFDVGELAREVFAGSPAAVAARAGERDLDAGLAATVLRLTLFPAIVRLAESVAPLVDGQLWRRGYCPICGSWPLLGEYRGLELTRFLRCGLCAMEWEVDRLVCPFCDNRLHQDLINLTIEGEEQKQRAVACARCHCYIKQISTLRAIPAPELLFADLQSLHLDLVAMQRNYTPPA